MPTYEQAIGAGGNINLPGGEVFYLLTANDAVDLVFYDKSNKPMDRWEGMKAGLNAFMFRDEKGNVQPFLHVNIYSATAQTIKVAISTARAIYQRSQGDVNVVSGIITTVQDIAKITRDDSWKYETGLARSFMGGFVTAGSVGVYGHVQLLNPAASGKVVYLRSLMAYASVVSAAVALYLYATPLVTNTTTLFNKTLGGAAPIAQLRAAELAALTGTKIMELGLLPVPPTRFLSPGDDPIIIPANTGLMVVGESAMKVGGYFEWVEV